MANTTDSDFKDLTYEKLGDKSDVLDQNQYNGCYVKNREIDFDLQLIESIFPEPIDNAGGETPPDHIYKQLLDIQID